MKRSVDEKAKLMKLQFDVTSSWKNVKLTNFALGITFMQLVEPWMCDPGFKALTLNSCEKLTKIHIDETPVACIINYYILL